MSLGFKVLELAINPDHVHLLISAYPTIPVHKIVKRIRNRSGGEKRIQDVEQMFTLPF
jgi:REP element-mobilizing transposase RayT